MASLELIKTVQSYDNYIEQHGVDEKAVDAYIEACKAAYLIEKDPVYGRVVSEKAKLLLDTLVRKITGGNIDLLEEWTQANDTEVKQVNQYYEILQVEARYYVDSFKLYIEKDRKRKDRFYLPRRKTLMRISDAIQRLENDELDILFLHQPPRTGKSGDITMDVLWHCARDTEKSNLYVTYKEGLGGAFLDGVKEILQDGTTYKFADIFPDVRIVATDAKNNKLDLNRVKKYKSLSGKGLESGLNGEYDATGWLVVDDPLEGIQDVLSKEVLKRKQTIFDNNVLSRKKEKCKLILLGTLWSVNDLYGNYLEYLETTNTALRYDIIKIPALNEKDESNFDYDYGVGFSSQYYINTRAKFEMNNDLAGWNAQYQQEPIERDGTVFNADDMNYYTQLPDGKPIKVIAHCDAAFGGEDFLSFPVAYYYEDDKGNLRGYIEDVVFDNAEKHITQPQVIYMIKKHKIRNVHFESNQGGEGYKDDVQREIKADKDYKEPCNITSSWAQSTKSKEQRIWDNAQDIRQLYFKDPSMQSKQYRAFMRNLFSFTIVHSKRAHDDAPDSLAGLVEFERYGSGVTKSKIISNLI